MSKQIFETVFGLMCESTMSAAEIEASTKMIDALEMRGLTRMEMLLTAEVALATLDLTAPQMAVKKRLIETVVKGTGNSLLKSFEEIVGTHLLAGSDLLMNDTATKAMSNWELLAQIEAHQKAQRELKYKERYDRFAFRCNAVGTGKGKGTKPGGDGGAGIQIVRGKDNKPIIIPADDEVAENTTLAYELAHKDIPASCFTTFDATAPYATEFKAPHGWGSNLSVVRDDNGTPILDDNGNVIPINTLLAIRGGDMEAWLNEVIYKKGKMKVTRRDLHEQITSAQEQWEKERHMEWTEATPDNAEPIVHCCGYDVAVGMSASVTVTDIPAGHKAVITVEAQPTDTKEEKATPVNASPVIDANTWPKKAVEGYVNSKIPTGKFCTKCNKGGKSSTITPYTCVPVDDRATEGLKENTLWEGSDLCGTCRNELTQQRHSANSTVKRIKTLEDTVLSLMQQRQDLESVYNEYEKNMLDNQKGVDQIKAMPQYSEAALQTLMGTVETFKANMVGVKKQAQDVSNQIDIKEQEIAQAEDALAKGEKPVSNGKATPPADAKKDTQQCKIISTPDTPAVSDAPLDNSVIKTDYPAKQQATTNVKNLKQNQVGGNMSNKQRKKLEAEQRRLANNAAKK